MKKLTAPILVVSLLGILLIYSCKKDITGLFIGKGELLSNIDWAKVYYSQTLEKQNSFSIKLMNVKGTSNATELKGNKKTPIWTKATTGINDLYSFVEIPLKYEHKISPTISISNNPNSKPVANQEIIDASFDRLIIFKDKDDKIGERIISFVPDIDYLRRHKGDISHNKIDQLDKDFFGYLHYKDWEGKALFVLRIESGKAIKKYTGFIKNIAFSQNLTSQKTLSNTVSVLPDNPDCTYLITWDWYQDCYYPSPESTTPTYCDPVVVYNVDYILLFCDETGGGGGPAEPEIVDCNNPAYFYTAECEENQPDTPCKHAKKLTKDALFRGKFKEIQDSVSGTVERAYVFKFSDNSYNLITGTANTVDPNITSPVDGFFHNHRTNVGHYGTFDMDDVGYIYQTYNDGNIIDVNTFVSGVATQYGTYILKIANSTQFETFGSENFTSPTKIADIADKYDDKLAYAMYTLGYDQKKATEYALLKAIEGSGLMLFIGNSNLTSWQAIKESSNNVINTNCDVE